LEPRPQEGEPSAQESQQRFTTTEIECLVGFAEEPVEQHLAVVRRHDRALSQLLKAVMVLDGITQNAKGDGLQCGQVLLLGEQNAFARGVAQAVRLRGRVEQNEVRLADEFRERWGGRRKSSVQIAIERARECRGFPQFRWKVILAECGEARGELRE